MVLSYDSPKTAADSLLPRPRLLALLDHAGPATITLITAPAGYGKSTLAEQWVSGMSTPVAWIALGLASNHPTQFLGQLLGAVSGTALPGDAPPPSMEAIVSALVERATAAEPLTVVFDDVHLIDNGDVLPLLDALLLARLPNVRWVLLSRTIPALTLARLRLDGLVQELGPEQLSFTRDEVAKVAALVSRHQESEDGIASLTDWSSGWIAAIRLALAAGHQARSGQMVHMQAAEIWLDDYLTEEVLGTLPEDLHDFVLRTSMLPYLDPALCDHVLGITTSAQCIARIRTRLVFVRSDGPDGRILTYHALFAESMMRILSRQIAASELTALRLRAAEWLEAEGLREQAAEQAVLARAWDRAISLIREIVRPLVNSDHSHSTRYWLEKLPEDHLLADPTLARWYIATMHYLGQHKIASAAYARVGPMWRASGDATQTLYDLFIRIAAFAMNGQPEGGMQQAYKVADLAPDDASLELMHVWSYIYQIESFRGDDDKADHAYREAERHRSHLPADQWYWLNNTEPLRYNNEAIRGRLRAAEQLYTRTLEPLRPTQAHHHGKLRARRSAIWLEWNHLTRVSTELDEIAAHIYGVPYRIWHPEVLLHIAQAKGALGDLDGMEEMLHDVRAVVESQGGRHDLNRLEAVEVELWLATDRLFLAQDWANRRAGESYSPPLLFGDPDPRKARVMTEIASGEPDPALKDLATMIDDATSRRRWAELVSLASWQMAALVMKGDTEGALGSLRLALRHGSDGGFVRSFMTPGVDVGPFALASRPLLDAREAAHLDVLIGHGIWEPREGTEIPAVALVEPLSSREMEVLALVGQGLRNRAIGERLFISERTVKKHVGNILRKLDVTSRHQAVVRAHLLGLTTADADQSHDLLQGS